MPVAPARNVRRHSSPSPTTTACAPTGRLQPEPSSREERPLAVHCLPGRSVLDHGEEFTGGGGSLGALDGHGSLADLRHHHVDGHQLHRCARPDVVEDAEHLQGHGRHDDRAALRHPVEAGVDVASELDEGQVRPQHRELGTATHRSGGDGSRPRAGRRAWQADEGSHRYAPLGEGLRVTSPAVGVDGRSLAECTARSARPSSTACWTSFTKTPCPPMTWSGTLFRAIPGRLDQDQLDLEPGVCGLGAAPRPPPPASAPPRCPAWRCAGWSRPAGRHGRSNRSRSALALRSPRGVPASSFSRTVGGRSFAMRPRVRASTASRLRGSSGQLALEAGQLGLAHVLGPVVQRAEDRCQPRVPAAVEVAVDLLGHDRPHQLGLSGPGLAATVGPGGEVLDVEDGDARELGGAALDVTGHHDVQHQERARGAAGHDRGHQVVVDDGQLGPGARDDDVGGRELVGQQDGSPRPGRRCGRRVQRPAGRAVGHDHSATPRPASATAAASPASPAPTTTTLDRLKDPRRSFGHLDRCLRDGRGAPADPGLRPCPLAHLERPPEEEVERGTRRALPLGQDLHRARTWPRFSDSPRTAERRPAATSNRWVAASSSYWLTRWTASSSGANPASPRRSRGCRHMRRGSARWPHRPRCGCRSRAGPPRRGSVAAADRPAPWCGRRR